MDLDNDDLKATRELYNPEKTKLKKVINKIYIYKADALLYHDDLLLKILEDLEKTLKGNN